VKCKSGRGRVASPPVEGRKEERERESERYFLFLFPPPSLPLPLSLSLSLSFTPGITGNNGGGSFPRPLLPSAGYTLYARTTLESISARCDVSTHATAEKTRRGKARVGLLRVRNLRELFPFRRTVSVPSMRAIDI